MTFSFAENFSPESKVWIYQSNRSFTDSEISEIDTAVNVFTKQWTAHDNQLKAAGKVLFNRFIILLVDESQAGASGCSIDKSVHFIQEIETKFGVNLFDRLNLLFKQEKEFVTIPVSEVSRKISEGSINGQSVFFNNTVQTLAELQTNWIIQIGESWLASRLKKEVGKA